MLIRKATAADVPSIAAIYSEIHAAEERGELSRTLLLRFLLL